MSRLSPQILCSCPVFFIFVFCMNIKRAINAIIVPLFTLSNSTFISFSFSISKLKKEKKKKPQRKIQEEERKKTEESFLLFDPFLFLPEIKVSVMESPQSVASTFNGIHLNGNDESSTKKADSDSFMGVLEVFVHQARDIQNICIYHKQDVYAKLSLTSDPETSLSTKIINGGGRNPVFDDTLQFHVKSVDCSLKCDIYMMSRVRNYLEDQLLGFALVPLSEVIVKNGKLEKEFSLSSTDLFHSPAGFVELSLSYAGEFPEVMMHVPAAEERVDETELVSIEVDESEFLDPKIVCENNQMVSSYLATPCTDSDDFVEVNSVLSAVVDTVEEAPPTNKDITNGISSPSIAVSSGSSGTHDDLVLSSKGNNSGSEQGEKKPADTIENGDGEEVVKPIVTLNFEQPEQKVVQQDIVDMYTKSLQQFTESLAKMKLPLDMDSPTQSENSSSSQQTPKSANSRVFYGSRAFF
ncbi:BnaC06g03720D [Brassica napus]|uniref:BnaC06g03720D protein n=1 Tax=Brassica napus TaxID=3708 RepID=A0A078HGY2_BRANA|nr:BnaC06g03720D [Brassica napus]